MDEIVKDILFLSYQEVLKKIVGQENHLLLANGFNYGLGVKTGYLDIFQKMLKDNYGIYAEAEPMIKECNYDLELFLKRVTDDIADENTFLKKYVCNKIKMDFMKALHEIVKSKVHEIYAEKNEDVYILLSKFTNYFTLNYDSFLYMLLLKFKPINNDSNNVMALEPTIQFIGEDLNARQNNIYNEIKSAREHGILSITGVGNNPTEKPMKLLPKTVFITSIKTYAKDKNKDWREEDIKKVVNRLLEEEKRNQVLNHVDDGSQLSLFENDFIYNVDSQTQNLFFLHGAFHIYKDGKDIKKITQETDKALYEKLEEILNSEDKNIVCVFESTDKLNSIQQNPYLKHCYDKLGSLSGNMVIIGSSLADNDNHIFNQINNSQISKVYISSMSHTKEKTYQLALEKFPNKEIYLFDAETISYEKPKA